MCRWQRSVLFGSCGSARYADSNTIRSRRSSAFAIALSTRRCFSSLSGLLNNNQDRYFFLQRRPGSGLEEDHCAFLQLSIALKTELHYETLLAAKILQLSESFQHKLGHLVGTMYSRVGTEDWVPQHATEEEFRGRTCALVEDTVVWLDKDLHRRVLAEFGKLQDEERTPEKFIEVVETNQKTKAAKLREGLDSIEDVLRAVGIVPELSGKIRRRA